MNTSAARPADATMTPHLVRTADGRSLHGMTMGSGRDLVVVEAGLGAGAASWGPVMELLAPQARVLTYDRAGYGLSEPDARPRELARLAGDLLQVIDSVPHERLVLVGHSWGGPIARVAASGLMEEATQGADGRSAGPSDGSRLAGLVLVDPADEHAELYFSRATRLLTPVQSAMLGVLSRLGLLAPLMRGQLGALPAQYRDRAAAAVSTPGAARTMTAESAQLVPGLRGLQQGELEQGEPERGRGGVGAVPLTVISGGRAGRLERSVRAQLAAAHAQRARAHPQGRLVVAERSGHMVPFTEPELVAEEILALLR